MEYIIDKKTKLFSIITLYISLLLLVFVFAFIYHYIFKLFTNSFLIPCLVFSLLFLTILSILIVLIIKKHNTFHNSYIISSDNITIKSKNDLYTIKLNDIYYIKITEYKNHILKIKIKFDNTIYTIPSLNNDGLMHLLSLISKENADV